MSLRAFSTRAVVHLSIGTTIARIRAAEPGNTPQSSACAIIHVNKSRVKSSRRAATCSETLILFASMRRFAIALLAFQPRGQVVKLCRVEMFAKQGRRALHIVEWHLHSAPTKSCLNHRRVRG